MFTRKDYSFFITSIIFLTVGYLLMVFDPVDNGFGIATLWIAPPILLAGFLLPAVGILGITKIMGALSLRPLRSNTWKHIAGFMAFLVALATYLITLEPTASLWDCSEFIASAYKLMVPHTPGAPLSLLIGRMFSMFSFGDVTTVARNINAMSALFSALTVFIVYHIIYDFAEKIVSTSHSKIPLILAALAGSLCLTFSDTFWFSAVEAETYGAACFFLLLLLWLILKGKDMAEPLRSRWLVLIFYIAGLAYCIHPMCVLTLPVLPFTWYVQSRKLTLLNILVTVVCGLAIVMVINRIVSIGLFELAFSFDLFFVNSLHLPFYSGAVVLVAGLIIGVIVLLKRYPAHAQYTWSVAFLLLGFLPYLLLFIRSNHNPPIDETNPENLSMIKAYMNRESYPSSPLIYGPYFDAQVDEVTVKKKIYFTGGTKYELAGTMPDYHYENSRSTILPRLYSNDPDHIASYRLWTGLRENEKPKFLDNLKFMFEYQLGHMYFRYLLWNFSGREGDHQNSNWLRPWDDVHVALSPKNENRARNQYWMIPFFLGIAGSLFQYKKDRKSFYSSFIFFLITGIILALYLNSTPNEPRERDYIYVGSYIAFCFWIGLGVLALYQLIPNAKASMIVASFAALSVPSWMAIVNFNDHNRAGRTFQIDNARSVLSSCAPNAILFTGGDNDTFPLWYLQEVEGYRTDVRVMVMSYMNTDWYINQLRKRYYQSAPFSLTLDEKEYRQYGANDVLYVHETIKQGIDVQKYLQLLKDEFEGLRMQTQTGDVYSILPSKTLKINVDKTTSNPVTLTGLHDTSIVSPELTFHVTGNYLQKNALAFMDVLVSNKWERPIYFNYTSLNSVGIKLDPHVIQEGNVYRLSAIENNTENPIVNTEAAYNNLVNNADYSNLRDSSINFNFEDYQARMITPLRFSLNSLAIALLEEGNPEKAQKVLDFSIANLYANHLPPSYANIQTADILMSVQHNEPAKKLSRSLFDLQYDQLQAQIKDGESIDRSDRFLIQQAAIRLDQLGEKQFLQRLKGME